MSAEPTFRCPVCRAAQTLGDTCRRCQADLRLVARVHRRLEYLQRLRAEALASGDAKREQDLATELHWLAPCR